ncbi:anaerobic ribonucleoside-triphosphate reductase activating protein [Clostridium sp. Sa3CUN1]|uniref:Anaerobic ribonucleoside-triphosphate reductase-activating protein n=1 Tax=Clostridium gallinarum TaxID=2762246 RepID=A0ABR8Q368_9CLOT|nr:anaerobic ribonucleoside-triphosphate reductase activating protein [Clostridium gallinarum]MBD7914860.1 anaerobic ribonucleoside-triphosphate reductase activating protein [Clostridium gallinarum]
MKKTIRLAGIAYESLVNGPGVRRVFFSQGCNHNCKGCFNTETHSFELGEEKDMDELIEGVTNNPFVKGVTFSGGDPLEQADKFSYIAKELNNKIKDRDFNIWCYTGYKFEYIIENLDKRIGWRELINNIDVLVDGKFEEDKKEEGLKFRGSSNQRIINVKESLESESIILLDL